MLLHLLLVGSVNRVVNPTFQILTNSIAVRCDGYLETHLVNVAADANVATPSTSLFLSGIDQFNRSAVRWVLGDTQSRTYLLAYPKKAVEYIMKPISTCSVSNLMQERSDVPYDPTLCTKSGYELLEMYYPELRSRRHHGGFFSRTDHGTYS
jgi:hypothetical protein